MRIERKNYPQLAQPVGPYVHAVKHGGLVYLSGLTAFGTASQGQSMAQQAQAIFDQIKNIATAEGTSLNALLKVTIFITGLDGLAELREVLTQTYSEGFPASSLVQVAALFSPDLCIEVEAVLASPAA